MVVRELSKHFVERWIERCGYAPSLEDVQAIIAEAQKTRRQVRVIEDGYPYRRFNILAEYWHNDLGMIIRVDERKKRAVTVITWNGRKRNGRA